MAIPRGAADCQSTPSARQISAVDKFGKEPVSVHAAISAMTRLNLSFAAPRRQRR
jgi:hypothetical protein